MTSPDVIVVGAGVIGLASAVAIADAGHSVCVVDPAPGAGASQAAAGMLSPGAEWSVEDPHLGETMIAARAQWPAFASQVSAVSAVDVTVHEVGSLFVAWDHSDTREWQRHLDVIARQGISSRAVERSEGILHFERLTPRISNGVLIDDDAYVDPDEVLRALGCAARSLDIRFVAHRAVRCAWDRSSVTVEVSGEVIRARCGIVATGAAPLAVDGVNSTHHVRPIRGVTLRLAGPAPDQSWMVRAIVVGRHLYAIGRNDGSVVIGATSDESWDVAIEARHVRQLLDDAVRIVPSLDDARFIEARVGLRPAPDAHRAFFELLGESPWAWSSGHFRHGYLLAPTAAASAREFVETKLS